MLSSMQFLPLKNRLDNVHVVEVLRDDEVFVVYGELVHVYHVRNGRARDFFAEAGDSLVNVHGERFRGVLRQDVQDQLVGR